MSFTVAVGGLFVMMNFPNLMLMWLATSLGLQDPEAITQMDQGLLLMPQYGWMILIVKEMS